jgi:hypothetical protein
LAIIRRELSSAEEWIPATGEFFTDLVGRLGLSDIERAELASDTTVLLGSCVNPRVVTGNSTGLVTGYVQSGKTRSIESVVSVARDNGYQMAIVLTGTSNALLVQSRGRLERDLGIEDGASDLGWVSVHKPADKDFDLVNGVLDSWRGDVEDWERRSPLLLVLKNASNIAKLADLLERLALSNVPTIVIDDEADQASLDNNARRPKAKPTATYLSIERMRRALPFHTYLQYTATPQAPLLISISDSLSPGFVHVLVPGSEYTGGRVFFGDGRSVDLIRSIDPAELDVTHAVRVPVTLKRAFRTFILGVADGLATGTRPNPMNRSMFIHPSRNREPHEKYEAWIRLLRDDWLSVLSEPAGNKERQALLRDFENDYAELKSTARQIADFGTLSRRLAQAISRLNIKVVNGLHTDEIRWKTSYAWVIIGGQSIDRGFTVEGLTVSYVPRPIGEGNADNFQQRARFFGYRGKYLDLCRVFMDDDSKRAFEKYVEHEEVMRAELISVESTGTDLKEWKRLFLLDDRFRPTRLSVLASGYFRTRLKGWLFPNWPHIDASHVTINNSAVRTLVDSLSPMSLELFPRHTHQLIPLSHVVDCLWPMEFPAPADSSRHTATMLALKSLLDRNPDEIAHVYLMDGFSRRRRTARDKTGVINPMQGRTPGDSDRYPGDEKIRDSDLVSVQLYNLTTVGLDRSEAEEVFVAAVRLPSEAVKSFVIQP